MSLFNSIPKPNQNATPATSSVPAGQFTEEDVKRALPTHMRASVTPSLVQTLNTLAADPLAGEEIRNNFVSYSVIMKEGKFKVEDYLNAVAYVSYKLMGYTNEDAYARVFPQRMNALIGKGTSKKDISSYVSAYNRGKLVNLILEQTLVPTWVLNQDIYQQAINTQADLMRNAVSEKVRSDAANSILTHLAKPKESNLQINIGETESSGMKEMKDLLMQLAREQQTVIASGEMRTIDVAAARITKTVESNE